MAETKETKSVPRLRLGRRKRERDGGNNDDGSKDATSIVQKEEEEEDHDGSYNSRPIKSSKTSLETSASTEPSLLTLPSLPSLTAPLPPPQPQPPLGTSVKREPVWKLFSSGKWTDAHARDVLYQTLEQLELRPNKLDIYSSIKDIPQKSHPGNVAYWAKFRKRLDPEQIDVLVGEHAQSEELRQQLQWLNNDESGTSLCTHLCMTNRSHVPECTASDIQRVTDRACAALCEYAFDAAMEPYLKMDKFYHPRACLEERLVTICTLSARFIEYYFASTTTTAPAASDEGDLSASPFYPRPPHICKLYSLATKKEEEEEVVGGTVLYGDDDDEEDDDRNADDNDVKTIAAHTAPQKGGEKARDATKTTKRLLNRVHNILVAAGVMVEPSNVPVLQKFYSAFLVAYAVMCCYIDTPPMFGRTNKTLFDMYSTSITWAVARSFEKRSAEGAVVFGVIEIRRFATPATANAVLRIQVPLVARPGANKLGHSNQHMDKTILVEYEAVAPPSGFVLSVHPAIHTRLSKMRRLFGGHAFAECFLQRDAPRFMRSIPHAGKEEKEEKRRDMTPGRVSKTVAYAPSAWDEKNADYFSQEAFEAYVTLTQATLRIGTAFITSDPAHSGHVDAAADAAVPVDDDGKNRSGMTVEGLPFEQACAAAMLAGQRLTFMNNAAKAALAKARRNAAVDFLYNKEETKADKTDTEADGVDTDSLDEASFYSSSSFPPATFSSTCRSQILESLRAKPCDDKHLSRSVSGIVNKLATISRKTFSVGDVLQVATALEELASKEFAADSLDLYTSATTTHEQLQVYPPPSPPPLLPPPQLSHLHTADSSANRKNFYALHPVCPLVILSPASAATTAAASNATAAPLAPATTAVVGDALCKEVRGILGHIPTALITIMLEYLARVQCLSLQDVQASCVFLPPSLE